MPSRSKVAGWFRVAAAGVAVASALGLFASIPVMNSYASRAMMAQRVQEDKTASDLFGSGGQQKIGPPIQMIIDDPKAFLPGVGDDGAKLISENYIVEHKIYPLQLKSVAVTVSAFRLGFAIAFAVSGGLWLVLRRRAA